MPDTATYGVSIAHRSPNQSTAPTLTEHGPIVATGLTWGNELSREGEASASTDPTTLPSNVITHLQEQLDNDDDVPGLELWIHRDSTRVFQGPIVGYQHQGDTLTFVARGLLYYLRYMHLIAATTFSDDDQHDIAVDLIEQWTGEDYGDFGIDTSMVSTSGTNRDRTFAIGDNVFQRVVELAEVDGGFDIWIDADRELHLGTQGSDLSGSVVLDRRGITDSGLSVSLAADDLASEALAISGELTATDTNTTLRQSFGRAGVVESFDSVTVQGTLNDHATALLDARSRPLVSPRPSLIPVSGAGVADFDVGDIVQFVPSIGIPDLVLNRRVLRKSVSVGDDGNESIGVELA